MKKISIVAAFFKIFWLLWLSGVFATSFATIRIVAAENFYGDVAKTIGASHVEVLSILNNPSQDPHAFSADPGLVRSIEQADIVIQNGLSYDAWMDRFVQEKKIQARWIVVGKWLDFSAQKNPHIWYDPRVMPLLARELAARLTALDPKNSADYQHHLADFLRQAKAYDVQIAQVKMRVSSLPVTATEPIAGWLAVALNLQMLNERLQFSVMNEQELTPWEVSKFEDSLRGHEVKALIYNEQVINPSIERFKKIAMLSQVPVVGMTETLPRGLHYYPWMNRELSRLAKALEKK